MTHGVIFSQMVLLRLIDKGISRENGYAIVQRNAMKAWQEGISFQQLLLEDQEVRACLSEDELRDVFKIENFLKNVDGIFKRVFAEESR